MKNLKALQKSKGLYGWNSISRLKLNAIYSYGGKKILDVGCSNGAYVKKLFLDGYDAYGCDVLEDKQWEKIDKARFKKADINKLPYISKSFDTVIAFEILEHISNPAKAIKELHRLAKKNIIISIPNCDLLPVFEASRLTYFHYVDRTHINFFNVDTITRLLKMNKFKIDSIQMINPVLPEILLLNSLHIPLPLASIIGKFMQILPIKRKFYTDIVIVASC